MSTQNNQTKLCFVLLGRVGIPLDLGQERDSRCQEVCVNPRCVYVCVFVLERKQEHSTLLPQSCLLIWRPLSPVSEHAASFAHPGETGSGTGSLCGPLTHSFWKPGITNPGLANSKAVQADEQALKGESFSWWTGGPGGARRRQ